MHEEQLLAGGIANAGSVVRVGAHVLRPSNAHTDAIHRFLSALHETGFHGAPYPIGIDPDGRERLRFVEGEVPVPPFPGWARSDTALASITELLARFHRASQQFDAAGHTWSTEMADPSGGSPTGDWVVCHNDVCLENVVFRDGVAVALLDFDFAAPGRPLYDLAQFARMCVPIDDDVNAERLGWEPVDKPARLRLVADTYGLDARERVDILETVSASIARGGEFVRKRVEAGDPNFIAMWNDMGGMERFDRRRRWWERHRHRFASAL